MKIFDTIAYTLHKNVAPYTRPNSEGLKWETNRKTFVQVGNAQSPLKAKPLVLFILCLLATGGDPDPLRYLRYVQYVYSITR